MMEFELVNPHKDPTWQQALQWMLAHKPCLVADLFSQQRLMGYLDRKLAEATSMEVKLQLAGASEAQAERLAMKIMVPSTHEGAEEQDSNTSIPPEMEARIWEWVGSLPDRVVIIEA